jgi:2,3-bisphosphoglycerate-dependent phosphoglycerate mutase
MKLILLRHGESKWNLLNKFTGWTDVGLTKKGIQEAQFSAKKILQEKILIDTIYTSVLLRSTHTSEIVADNVGFDKKNIKYDWRLNERHYGALQGLNKSETAAKYGEDQVHLWRRSYDVAPPLLPNDDERHPRFNKKFKNIENMPAGESLKNVTSRLNPFWNQYLANIKENLGNHLIVAHSNSLRAIVKLLDQLSDEEIVSVNIPTGVPLVYEFDDNFNVIHKEYLIDQAKLEEKQTLVADQGKAE